VRITAPFVAFLTVLTPIVAPAADTLVPDAARGAHRRRARAKRHAALAAATHVAQDLALHRVRELPRHGGMLVSAAVERCDLVRTALRVLAHRRGRPGRIRYGHRCAVQRAHRDDSPDPGFIVRARYIIEVPAGEAIPDGLIPGGEVRIDADAQRWRRKRDHSRAATPRCPVDGALK
jgi:hypothetical protein